MNQYKAFRVKQQPDSTVEFLLFVAPARDVNNWAHADDIRLDKNSVQRELVESRWRQVMRFFKADPQRNVIPTNVTLAFDSELRRVENLADLDDGQPGYFLSDNGDQTWELVFPDSVRDQTYVIDGQHRLKGMAAHTLPINVPIALLMNLPPLERAFQFVTINNKSHKVPTDNLKALIHNFSDIEEGLRARLSNASITSPRFATHIDVMNEQTDSPFYKMVAWVNNRHADGKQVIAPTAIENALKEITRAFPETKEDDADAILVLSSIWKEVFSNYGITIANIEDYKNLTTKAVIQTITNMIVERIVKERDPAFSPGPITRAGASEARETAIKLIRDIPADFWKEEWSLRSLDTSAGRAIIINSIRQLKINLVNQPNENWRSAVQLYGGIETDGEAQEDV